MIEARHVQPGYRAPGDGPTVTAVSTIEDDTGHGITTLFWSDGTVTYSEPFAKMVNPETDR